MRELALLICTSSITSACMWWGGQAGADANKSRRILGKMARVKAKIEAGAVSCGQWWSGLSSGGAVEWWVSGE